MVVWLEGTRRVSVLPASLPCTSRAREVREMPSKGLELVESRSQGLEGGDNMV